MRSDEELNKRFYENSPQQHFEHRLRVLLVATQRPHAIWETLREEPIIVGSVRLDADAEAVEVNKTHEEVAQNFLTTEVVQLLHQCGEALLRLYLAHVDVPPCPWLEVAGLVSHRKLKRRIRAEVLEASETDLMEGIRIVFLAGAELGEAESQTLETYSSLLRRVARIVLDDAALYNSAKHGLAVVPSTPSVYFATENPAEGRADPEDWHELGKGTALEHLDSEKVPEGRLWRLTTRWVDIPRSASLVLLICKLMENLWTTARRRYLEEHFAGMTVLQGTLEELLPPRSTGGLTRFSESLGVESKAE